MVKSSLAKQQEKYGKYSQGRATTHCSFASIIAVTGDRLQNMNEQELRKLIDLLVTHRLHRLKPKITEEIIEELQRLKPELFRRQGK